MSRRTLNEKLIHARLSKGWTQEEACKHVDVPNVRSWQRWETEGVIPSPYFRQRLCEVFGLSLVELGIPPRGARSVIATTDTSTGAEGEIPDMSGSDQLELTLTDAEVAMFIELRAGEHAMNHFNSSRRAAILQALSAMAALSTASGVVKLFAQSAEPFERLAMATTKPRALDNGALNHFEHLIAQGWELSNNNQLKVAGGVLSSFLPEVLALPSYDARTARIASQGLRLQSVLTHHQLKIADKVRMCEKSVEYARYANDANTLVAALVELAAAYEFDNQLDKWLNALQEALFYSTQASALNQAHAYSYSSVAFAGHNRKKEAEFYIQLAYEVFPDDPLADPDYAFADMNMGTLSYHAGLVRLRVGRIAEAPDAFESYREHPSGVNVPERIRLETVNGQSKAAIALGDRERYADLFESAITRSLALGSKKRFDEAYAIFRQNMPEDWLTYSRIKEIMGKHQLTWGKK